MRQWRDVWQLLHNHVMQITLHLRVEWGRSSIRRHRAIRCSQYTPQQLEKFALWVWWCCCSGTSPLTSYSFRFKSHWIMKHAFLKFVQLVNTCEKLENSSPSQSFGGDVDNVSVRNHPIISPPCAFLTSTLSHLNWFSGLNAFVMIFLRWFMQSTLQTLHERYGNWNKELQ